MQPALEPITTDTLVRMLRYALRSGADRVDFQPGRRPQLDGLGGCRELRHRQLTGEDTGIVADYFLSRGIVSERLSRSATDGASSLPLLVEWRRKALFDARLWSVPGGLRVCVDVIRPLPESVRRAIEHEA